MSPALVALAMQGPAALSPFRIAKLLERLRTLEPSVSALDSRFMHFIEAAGPLPAPEQAMLAQLLSYGPRLAAAHEAGGGESLLIVPRAGTISPWSSKATDIAHVCGLAGVRRIERGIEYRVHAAPALGSERLLRLAPLLSDRMTEMALLEPAQAPQQLFAHAPPRALARVSLATGGRRSRRPTAGSDWRCRRTRWTTCWRASVAWGAIRPTSS